MKTLSKLDALLVALFLTTSLSLAFQKNNYRDVKQYTIEQFMNTTRIIGSSVSHDDKLILFSSNKTGVFNAYTIPVKGGKPTQLTDSKDNSIFTISFFPDDNRILYSSDKGGNEISHIYLRNEDGNALDLTPDEKARAEFYGWSHDQKSFFFGFNKRDPKFMDIFEMDIASFTPNMVYQNDSGYTIGTISNNKRYMTFVKTITDHNNDMYLFDTQTKAMKYLTPHTGDINYSPESFSADSKSLYFLTDDGSEFTYLKRYDITSENAEKVEEASWDIQFAAFSWNGTYRVIGINNDARTEIKIYDNATNSQVKLPKLPDADITSINISESEKLMTFYVNGSRSPNNLYVYDFKTKEYTKLTDAMNPEIHPADLVDGSVVRYKSFDGTVIPAIIYQPHQIKTGEKVPALVSVHGGPGGQSRIGYSPLKQYLVNHGYVVIDVNNRGSSGYGKTFYAMDDRKHGEEDLGDCIDAKKYLAATGYVDENKVGIFQ